MLKCLEENYYEHIADLPRDQVINPNRIKEGSKYYFKDACGILDSLVMSGDAYRIEEMAFDHKYGITEKGMNSCFEKHYLNQIWWRSWWFLSVFVPILFSFAALIVSIFALVNSNHCSQ